MPPVTPRPCPPRPMPTSPPARLTLGPTGTGATIRGRVRYLGERQAASGSCHNTLEGTGFYSFSSSVSFITHERQAASGA